MKKTLTFYIIIFAFFLLSVPTLAQDNANDRLSIKSEIANIQKNKDNSFTIDYKYSVKNNSDKLIYEVIAKSDLKKSFGDLEYEILELKSDKLEINYDYNGLTNSNLTKEASRIEPNSNAEINLKIKLYPKNNKGPFENFVDIYGSYDGPSNQNENNNGNGGNGDNNNSGQYPTPDPQPPVVETDLTPRDIKFTLVDAEHDQDLFEIYEGMIIKLDTLPSNRLNVRVDISPSTVGSIVFDLNGKKNFHTESNPIYALGGNKGNDYYSWLFKVGKQELTASVNTMPKGAGEVINFKKINFLILGTQPADPVVEEIPPTGEGSIEDPNGEGDPGSETPGNVGGENTSAEDAGESSIESTSASDSNSFSLIFDENGEVLAEISDKVEKVEEEASVLGEATLVNTGINLADSVFLGVLIIILVVELNFFEMEDRFFNNVYHYAEYFGGKKRKGNNTKNKLSDWLNTKDEKIANNKNRKFHTRL